LIPVFNSLDQVTIMLLTILILAGILVLALIFRKFLKLLFLRIIFGKYSYEYVKQFKKYARKSPFPYCFKDDILPYLRLSRQRPESIKVFEIDKEIHFESIPFGLDEEKFFDNWKSPDCFNVFRINDMDLKAFGYLIDEFNLNTKAVFYFLDDIYTMGEYIINNIKESDILNVSKQILEKYEITPQKTLNRFFIESKNTSVYFYENGFSITIRFTDKTNDEFKVLV